VEVPIRDLFESPTLEEFAKRVRPKVNASEVGRITGLPLDVSRDVNEMSNEEMLAEIAERQRNS